MRDFLGRQLDVGDYVVCVEKGYRNMKVARVLGLTKTAARVVYLSRSPVTYLTSSVVRITVNDLGWVFQSTGVVELAALDDVWQRLMAERQRKREAGSLK